MPSHQLPFLSYRSGQNTTQNFKANKSKVTEFNSLGQSVSKMMVLS